MLVLCFNVPLASKLRSLLVAKDLNPQVTVRHFHGWCKTCLTLHLPRPDARKYQGEDYIGALEQSVMAAVESGHIPRGQYRVVIKPS